VPTMSARTMLSADEADEMFVEPRPTWRRRPCRATSAAAMPEEELIDKLDSYFNDRWEKDRHPTFCDLAGATGFDSVTQLLNHARRKGGNTMRAISRALLAVGAGYEEQAQDGSRTAIAMLERLPQFDSEEPSEQIPVLPFQRQQEVQVNISGLQRAAEQGQQLTAQEAYLKIIKHKTFKEVEADVMELEKTEDGTYSVLEISEDE